MARHGKKYRKALEGVDRAKRYGLEEAVALVKGLSYAKYDEAVEMSVRLGIDAKKTDQLVRGSVVLPHGLATSLGRPLAPDIIYIPNPGLNVASDTINITLTNNGSTTLSGSILVEAWHTIERAFKDVNNESLPVKPYIVVSLQQGNVPPQPGCVNHPDDAAIAILNGDQTFWGADMADHNLFQQFAGSPYPDGLTAWPSGTVGAPGTWNGDSGWLLGRWSAWVATPPVRNQLTLWNLLADTEYYFNAVLATQNTGQWVGWLAPSIIEHILEETVYFRQAVFGDATAYTPTPTPKVWTPQQLRQIWTEWIADHAVNVSHFLDPQQTLYVDQAVAFHDTFTAFNAEVALQTIGCACDLDPKIIEGNVNFDAFLDALMIGTPQAIPSVLIIQIITHLKAEGLVCNQIVSLLDCGPP